MHTSCKLCGSSDANFIYPDGGSFCFSCRSPGGRRCSPYVRLDFQREDVDLSLPDDSSRNYPEHVLSWTSKYHITVEELIKHDVFYSEQRDQLIFTWKGADNELVLWQARNFSKAAKAKCYTKGKPEECIQIYYSKPRSGLVQRMLVLVEDPISAIKLSRFTASLPVLGSDLSLGKIKRIAGSLGPLLGMSEDTEPEVVVWLDGNMFHKAQRIAQRFQLLGVKARAVYTVKDPKEYDDASIRNVLAVD